MAGFGCFLGFFGFVLVLLLWLVLLSLIFWLAIHGGFIRPILGLTLRAAR